VIIKGLHDLLVLIVSGLFAAVPSYFVPPGVGLSVLSAANFVLPLSELGLVMTAIGAFAVASLGYALVVRVVTVIRG
jgi:polyferredoxin